MYVISHEALGTYQATEIYQNLAAQLVEIVYLDCLAFASATLYTEQIGPCAPVIVDASTTGPDK